jgi:hypothetical protein
MKQDYTANWRGAAGYTPLEHVTDWIKCFILENVAWRTMTVIELPDDQAAALKEKAAVEGLSLEDWLRNLAGGKPPAEFFPKEGSRPNEGNPDTRPISEVIAEIMKDVPPEELAQLPKDGASQVDHYVYGLPKRHE